MNWLLKQLTTPSTHNALAALATAALPVLPEPWGYIAIGVFVLLGIITPEAGEKALPVRMPAVKAIWFIPFALFIGMGVASCTTTEQQQAQSAACIAQSVLNAAAVSGQAQGDTKLTSAASVASATVGALCTGLATDTPMVVQPAPVNALPSKPTA